MPPAPSAQQRELLQALLDHPGDKRARQIYGDLLEDAGDPRGELINLQCARADLPADDARLAEILAREAELLKQHKKAWTTFGQAGAARYELRWGMVEKASLDAADLIACGATLFAREPVEELAIWKIAESAPSPAGSRLAPVLQPWLRSVRRLSLARSELTEQDVEALATATCLANVEVLDLTSTAIGPSGAELLARATSLPRLRELRVGTCFLEDDGLEALARSPTLRLERLLATRDDISPRGAQAIADATWASDLVHLDLSSNELLGDDGLRALADAPRLTSLRSLVLEYVGLGDDAAAIVLGSAVCARLEHLDLSSNLSGADVDRIRATFGDRLHMRHARH